MCRYRFLALSAAIAAIAPLRPLLAYEAFNMTVVTPDGTYTAGAEEIRGRYWVDATFLAGLFDGTVHAKSRTVYQLRFPDHVAGVDLRRNEYTVRYGNKGPWETHRFDKNPTVDGGRLMLPLSSIPTIFGRSFVYHHQRRQLSLDTRSLAQEEKRALSLRHESQDGKDWISLDDLANALGIVLFSAGGNRLNLVLPDFSIVEVRIADRTVYRRDSPYLRLEDAPLLIGGNPYLTVAAASQILNADVEWDATRNEALVPTRFGRLRNVPDRSRFTIRYLGEPPRPLHVSLDELSLYYQDPEPSFSTDPLDVYDSVRDPLTNRTIDPPSRALDRTSGEARLSLDGLAPGGPITGSGSIEKLGGTTHLVNGSLNWGFPGLRIHGGREYMSVGDFNNQFNRVDGVWLSHSNDKYGDGSVAHRWDVEAGFGRTDVDVFISTALFSEEVGSLQTFERVSLGSKWKLPERRSFSFRAEQYTFKTETRRTDAAFADQGLLTDIFGNDVVTVDPADQAALAASVLPSHHETSVLTASYDDPRIVTLSASGALSRYRDHDTRNVRDGDDWILRSVWRRSAHRLDVSYENVSDHFVSVGNPLRYQARQIFRVAPYLDVRRWWKFFGEFRREDSAALRDQGTPPYRNDYISATNVFSGGANGLRTMYVDYDSTLFGRRRSSEADYTRYLGRHSVDVGGEWERQWLADHSVFANSRTAKAGVHLEFSGWGVGAGEEWTHHEYPGFFRDTWESLSSLSTHVRAWRALAQYQRKPRIFNEDPILHTGTVRIGRQTGENKAVSAVLSSSSLRANLSHPEVWRAGLDYSFDF